MKRKVPAVIVTTLLLLTAMFRYPPSTGLATATATTTANTTTTATGSSETLQLISLTKRLQVAASVYLNSLQPAVQSLEPAPGLAKEVVGYYSSDWDGDTASLDSINAYGARMSGVALFAFQLKADGTFGGQAPEAAVSKTGRNGGKAMALLHNCINGAFDQTIAHAVLSDQAIRARTISNIMAIVRNNGLAGVNVDLENIPAADRPAFNRFISDLSQTLHKKGYLVTISVPAKTFDEKTGWGGAFDYRVLGAYVDRMMLMTYDEHWFGGSAGPVASIGWVENVIRYAVSQVPADKLLLGLGMYGYDWNVSTGKSAAAMSSVDALGTAYRRGALILWDDAAQVPYYYYTTNGVKHVVWFESNESAAFKLDLVNKYNLGGVAIWRLGFEDSGFWQLIDKKFARVQ